MDNIIDCKKLQRLNNSLVLKIEYLKQENSQKDQNILSLTNEITNLKEKLFEKSSEREATRKQLDVFNEDFKMEQSERLKLKGRCVMLESNLEDAKRHLESSEKKLLLYSEIMANPVMNRIDLYPVVEQQPPRRSSSTPSSPSYRKHDPLNNVKPATEARPEQLQSRKQTLRRMRSNPNAESRANRPDVYLSSASTNSSASTMSTLLTSLPQNNHKLDFYSNTNRCHNNNRSTGRTYNNTDRCHNNKVERHNNRFPSTNSNYSLDFICKGRTCNY